MKKMSIFESMKASFNEALLRRMYKTTVKGALEIGIEVLKSIEDAIDNPIIDQTDEKEEIVNVKPKSK